MIDGLKPDDVQWLRVGEKPKATYARLATKIGYKKAAWLADVSKQTIATWRKKHVGEIFRHGGCEIPDAVVIACRRAYFHDEESVQRLAKRYGVVTTTLYKAISGQTYQHLPMPWDEESASSMRQAA